MDAVTDPALHQIPFDTRNLQSASFQPPHRTLASQLEAQLGPDFDPNDCYPHSFSTANNVYAQSQAQSQPQPRVPLQSQQPNGRQPAANHSPPHHDAQSGNNTFGGSGAPYPALAAEQQYQNQQPLAL